MCILLYRARVKHGTHSAYFWISEIVLSCSQLCDSTLRSVFLAVYPFLSVEIVAVVHFVHVIPFPVFDRLVKTKIKTALIVWECIVCFMLYALLNMKHKLEFFFLKKKLYSRSPHWHRRARKLHYDVRGYLRQVWRQQIASDSLHYDVSRYLRHVWRQVCCYI